MCIDKVETVASVYRVVCPGGQYSCDDNSTCCKNPQGQWACCPEKQGVCCSDHLHCCPHGYTCDVTSLTCTPDLSVLKDSILRFVPIRAQVKATLVHTEEEVEAVTSVHRVVCPGGQYYCDDDSTCCQNPQGQWACCPEKQVETVASIHRVVCPGGQYYCDDDSTCCQNPQGQWACCPEKQGVCCSDHLHCCPHGYTCDVTSLTCNPDFSVTKDSSRRFVVASAQIRASRVKDEIECPDNISTCPENTTCCEMKNGYYGCCQYENAVCCSDKLHCCPHDMQCNVTTGECINSHYTLRFGLPESQKVPRIVKVSTSIECPDKSTCPEKTTCCELPSKTYGCCPFANAHCCADHIHCCPSDQICDLGKGECQSTDQLSTQPLGVKFPSTPQQSASAGEEVNVICPDRRSQCLGQSTCCKIGVAQYGCCNLPQAVCCADMQHCCPKGYTCNDKQGYCSRGNDNLPWLEHHVSSEEVEDGTIQSAVLEVDNGVMCPDQQTECPSGNTCCLLTTGEYGCCPFTNAVCCSDHLHCCPEGHTCNLQAQSCDQQNTRSVPWFKKRPALQRQVKVLTDVQCPDKKSSCPDGTTCCLTTAGIYGCCPLEKAVCCSDNIHCCPEGTTCDVAAGTCVSSDIRSLQITWSTTQHRSKLEQSVRDVVCPDLTTQCSSGQTCCKLLSGEYGCCPLPSATCCPNSDYCCPNGMVCDTPTHMCVTSSPQVTSQVPWTVVQKLSPGGANNKLVGDILCPGKKVQCHHDQTCCKLTSGDYGCCPLPVATCCSDGIHCCPHGDTCDVTTGSCISGATETIAASVRSMSHDVICPDHKVSCHHDQTCCKLAGGTYGCCPLPAATCCSDGIHCCPHGSQCDAKTGSCIQGNSILTISWTSLKRTNMLTAALESSKGLVGAVLCPDKTECPWGTTCCVSATGKYACCSEKNATCCADKVHCCPQGYTCSSTPGKCEKPPVTIQHTRIPWFKKVAATPVEDNELTDLTPRCRCDHHETCCPVGEGFGCCRWPRAQCCADQKTCCPSGYECTGTGRCIRK